jgi:hypothetical protein
MGPCLIFDKSFLQSLNPDESLWLDNFFNTNITPLFFVETLADLEKEVKNGHSQEEVVGSLAYKTPDMSARPNVHHLALLEGELMDHKEVHMTGKPIISGGQPVKVGDKVGVIFDESPEEKAFSRWQKGEFMEAERLYARAWREALLNIDLGDKYILFQKYFTEDRPKNLADVRSLAERIVNTEEDIENTLIFGLWLIGVPFSNHKNIIDYWKSKGSAKISEFAPYFYHVFLVDMFFYLGIAADLISRGRASHKIDLAYLYYLPFCNIFVSGDKLHKEIAPHFISGDQMFIYGPELKADLKLIDEHYSAIPDELKARGVSSFAMFPPQDKQFLVCELWDKYMAKDWRNRDLNMKPQAKTPASEFISNEIKEMQNKANFLGPESVVDLEDANSVVIKRMVRGTKGKWTRFPPEVINRKKNENGEWVNKD